MTAKKRLVKINNKLCHCFMLYCHCRARKIKEIFGQPNTIQTRKPLPLWTGTRSFPLSFPEFLSASPLLELNRHMPF